QPGVETKEKREIVLNRRQNSTEENIDAFNQKDQLVKKRSYACETQCFPVEPSDVEEVPSHDGETV
ncbi:hypothetical protein TNCV_511461, partial [Trichonephila clavipes]